MNMGKHFIGASIFFLFIACFVFASLKKEISFERCRDNSKAPTSVAGLDQIITLPTDSVLLDRSSSNDPYGTISEWLWKKISGSLPNKENHVSVANKISLECSASNDPDNKE